MTAEKNDKIPESPKYSPLLRNPVTRFLRENLGILIGLLILCLILTIYDIHIGRTVFLSTNNIMNVLRQVSTNLYIACGMTMIIILGGIDLSVGSIMSLSGCVTGMLLMYKNFSLLWRS